MLLLSGTVPVDNSPLDCFHSARESVGHSVHYTWNQTYNSAFLVSFQVIQVIIVIHGPYFKA